MPHSLEASLLCKLTMAPTPIRPLLAAVMRRLLRATRKSMWKYWFTVSVSKVLLAPRATARPSPVPAKQVILVVAMQW
ncbi:MAG: hypothetical protein FRX49_08194 [Trebouxia sp. A1-2]|nr:MAG: hypothetical protein FRX49_08194 [Trebouxia sp. A1-2]